MPEENFEEWAKSSHLKSVTLDVLRNNDIDDMATVRLINSEDIKVPPIPVYNAATILLTSKLFDYHLGHFITLCLTDVPSETAYQAGAG